MHPQIVQAAALLLLSTPDSLDEAVRLLRQAVFRMSFKNCHHREDAEDVTQEVLSRSLRYLGRFQDPDRLAVWLYVVTKNESRRMYRKAARCPAKTISLDSVLPDRRETLGLPCDLRMSPEAALLRHEEAWLLWRAILRVPGPLRSVLVLHDLKEFTTSEIAEILRLKQGTIRVRLHRARLRVRDEINNIFTRDSGEA